MSQGVSMNHDRLEINIIAIHLKINCKRSIVDDKMLDSEEKELTEKDLELKISEHPQLIEKGLKLVANQRRAGRGPLDILLLDSGNALVVTELKVAMDDDMLTQALDYFGHVYSHLEALALAYEVKGFKIDPSQEPRIMLIAPDFSETLVNRCMWLSVNISLYRYRFLIMKKDGKELGEFIDFMPIEIPSKPEREEEVPTKEKVLSYITAPGIIELAKQFQTEIEKWDQDIKVGPVKGALSFKIKKDVFIYLYPQRNSFSIFGYITGHDDWQRLITINSSNDLKEAYAKSKQCYENIKQK